MTDLTDHIPTQADVDRHPHMRGLKIPDHKRKRVDLLICVGESALHHPYETRTAGSAQLWATKTGLGWVVHGRDSGIPAAPTSSSVQVNHFQARSCEGCAAPAGEAEILDKVRKSFAIDFAEPQHGNDMVMSRHDQQMLKRQEESFRMVDGRCEVAMLWKKPPQALPNNRRVALQSLQRLGRRLKENPELAANYKEFVDKLIENNQARLAPAPLGAKPGWFLLHHAVLEKFRVVFNGAAEFQGVCLNDHLDKGPDHTSSLLGTVLRFRRSRYAVMADIKGMFYNVSIPAPDRRKPVVEGCKKSDLLGLLERPATLPRRRGCDRIE